jgi:diazepam-binding inhibitor (GABA receptor modulating acyl-CoA-binding protein)
MSQAEFDKAAEDVKNLTKKPSDDQLLKIYGLFKRKLTKTILLKYLLISVEGTVGDVNTSRPGMLDLKGKAKWDAWEQNKGKSKEHAQQEYVALVRKLQSS